MNKRRRNRRDVNAGTKMRASDVQLGHRSAARDPGRLWPCLAIRPTSDRPVDAVALVAELARLADLGRRAGS